MELARKNLLLRNLDAYYFSVNTFFEFPEIDEKDVRQLMYDEFGFSRFSKYTFNASLIVMWAKIHTENLAQIYASGD